MFKDLVRGDLETEIFLTHKETNFLTFLSKQREKGLKMQSGNRVSISIIRFETEM